VASAQVLFSRWLAISCRVMGGRLAQTASITASSAPESGLMVSGMPYIVLPAFRFLFFTFVSIYTEYGRYPPKSIPYFAHRRFTFSFYFTFVLYFVFV
jgi:hypothetical protein